jgi:hypothetical protein
MVGADESEVGEKVNNEPEFRPGALTRTCAPFDNLTETAGFADRIAGAVRSDLLLNDGPSGSNPAHSAECPTGRRVGFHDIDHPNRTQAVHFYDNGVFQPLY